MQEIWYFLQMRSTPQPSGAEPLRSFLMEPAGAQVTEIPPLPQQLSLRFDCDRKQAATPYLLYADTNATKCLRLFFLFLLCIFANMS